MHTILQLLRAVLISRKHMIQVRRERTLESTLAKLRKVCIELGVDDGEAAASVHPSLRSYHQSMRGHYFSFTNTKAASEAGDQQNSVCSCFVSFLYTAAPETPRTLQSLSRTSWVEVQPSMLATIPRKPCSIDTVVFMKCCIRTSRQRSVLHG